MAQQPDIVGMFTGISSNKQPIVNDPTGAIARIRRNQQNLRGAVTGMFGKETSEVKQQRQIANMIASFDSRPPAEQKQILAQLQTVGQGGLAQQLAAQAQATKQATQTAQQQAALKTFVTSKLGQEYGPLVESGAITIDNYKDFVADKDKKGDKRYLVAGSNVFDTQSGTWQMSPKTEELIKVGDNLYNPQTEQFITPPKEDPQTTKITEYNFLRDQNTKLGIPTPTFENWSKGKTNAVSPQTKLYYEAKRDHELNKPDTPFGYTLAEWIDRNKKADLKTVEVLDPLTGFGNSYLVNNEGERVQNLGITKLPTYEIKDNDDGTYYVMNKTTGDRGKRHKTVESAKMEQDAFNITMSNINQLDSTLGIIGDAKELGQDMGIAGALVYDVFKKIPLTESKQLANKISTIQANLAFDRLQKMRNESPTGGALGQVSNMELGLLRDAVSALDPTAGVEAFNEQIKIVEQHYNRFRASLIGQTDFRVKNGFIYIQSPDGTIHKVKQGAM